MDIVCCQPSPTLLAVLLGTWCLEELPGGSVPPYHISEAMLIHGDNAAAEALHAGHFCIPWGLAVNNF